MSIMAQLFGSSSTVEKAINDINKTPLAPEVKVEYFENILKAYEPFKLVQRLLAVIVGIPYVVTWLICVFLFILGTAVGTKLFVDAAIKLATMNNEALSQPFIVIITFYAGGGMLEGAIGKWKK